MLCSLRTCLLYYFSSFLSSTFFLLTIKTQSNTVRFKRACVLYLTFRLLSRGFFVIFRVHDITIAYYTFKKLYNEDFVLYRSYYFAQQSKLPLPSPCSSYTLCKIYCLLHTVVPLFIKFSQIWNA